MGQAHSLKQPEALSQDVINGAEIPADEMQLDLYRFSFPFRRDLHTLGRKEN